MGVSSQFDFVAPSPPPDRGGGSGGGGSGGLPAYPYRERTSTRRETAIRSANVNLFSTFYFSPPFELNPRTTKPRATGLWGIVPAVLSSVAEPAGSRASQTNVCQRQPHTTSYGRAFVSPPEKEKNMNSRSALSVRAPSSEGRHMEDRARYSHYCRVVKESSIGYGWRRLVHVLAELEVHHDSLPPRRPSGRARSPDTLAKADAA